MFNTMFKHINKKKLKFVHLRKLGKGNLTATTKLKPVLPEHYNNSLGCCK
jgi:hypothetical protein